MLKIGLTGGLGSGKTTAAEHFAALGVPVIDADRISRDLTRQGGAAYGAVIELFGPDIAGPEGELRRDRIRERVFTDAAARRALETIIHPLVRREIEQRIRQLDEPYCIVSAPLLLETRMQGMVDRVLVVDADEASQVSRAMSRDHITRQQAEDILRSQMDRRERLKLADDIVSNDGDLQGLRAAIDLLHQKYRDIADRRIATSR